MKYRMTLVGDSLFARSETDGLRALRSRLEAEGALVDMLAVGGATSKDTLEAIRSYNFDNSSLVLISIGMNDAAYWKQVRLSDFIENYRAIIDKIGHDRIVMITPHPVDTQKQEAPGRSNGTLAQYAAAIISLAENQRLSCVDFFTEVSMQSPSQDLYAQDGVHLNTQGYDLLFRTLKKFLKNN